MGKEEKAGLVWGVVGASLGSLAWAVLLGISIGSFGVAIAAAAGAAACIILSIKAYELKPERKLSIIGVSLVWLALLNIVFLNILYERIPEMVGGISTGKSQISLPALNVFLGAFFLAGLILFMTDIVRKK